MLNLGEVEWGRKRRIADSQPTYIDIIARLIAVKSGQPASLPTYQRSRVAPARLLRTLRLEALVRMRSEAAR